MAGSELPAKTAHTAPVTASAVTNAVQKRLRELELHMVVS
jgi:hypothetical protein